MSTFKEQMIIGVRKYYQGSEVVSLNFGFGIGGSLVKCQSTVHYYMEYLNWEDQEPSSLSIAFGSQWGRIKLHSSTKNKPIRDLPGNERLTRENTKWAFASLGKSSCLFCVGFRGKVIVLSFVEILSFICLPYREGRSKMPKCCGMSFRCPRTRFIGLSLGARQLNQPLNGWTVGRFLPLSLSC